MQGVRLIERCSFGEKTFQHLLCDGVDALCHHGASVENFKSLDFDIYQALHNNTNNLKTVLSLAKNSNVKGVFLTGSVFEQDEGIGDANPRAFSPYGLSKGMTWQMFRFWCDHFSLPLHKFVIPNPFGPFEEPRFCHYLMKTWLGGETPQINTPEYVRDNIHVSFLAKAYAYFVSDSIMSSEGLRLNPSGYVETQGAFATRFAREIGIRLKISTPLIFGVQKDFSEPMVRINTDRNLPVLSEWSECESWDELAEYYNISLDFHRAKKSH